MPDTSFLVPTIVGVVSALVTALATQGLAYVFWKRQHRAEATLAEGRYLRDTRLLITDRVRQLITELLAIQSFSGIETIRQIELLKSMRGPIARFSSSDVVTAFEAAFQTAIANDESQRRNLLPNYAAFLVSKTYDEGLWKTV